MVPDTTVRVACAVVVIAALAAVAVPANTAAGSGSVPSLSTNWREQYSLPGPDSDDGEKFTDAVVLEEGYLLVGRANRRGWVVRVGPRGEERWNRTLAGEPGVDTLQAVERLPTGGFLLAGTTGADSPYLDGRTWLVRVGPEGAVRNEYVGAEGSFNALVAAHNDTVLAVGTDLAWVADDGSVVASKHVGSAGFADAAPTADGYVAVGFGDGLTYLDDSGAVARRTDRPTADWLYAVTATPERVAAGGYVHANDDFTPVLWWRRNGTAAASRRGVGVDRGYETWDLTTVGGEVVAVGGSAADSGGWVARFGPDGEPRTVRRFGGEVRGVVPLDDGRVLLVGTGRGALAGVADLRRPDVALDAPTHPEVGMPAELDAGASARVGNGTTYRWDLDGDGAAETTTDRPRLNASFRSLDPRNVTVTAVSANGLTDAATAGVDPVDTTPPTPNLSVPANRLVAPAGPATLNASATADNGRVVRYRWDFDADGEWDATTTNATVTHRFAGVDRSHEIVVGAVDAAGNANETTIHLRSVPNDRPNVSVRTGVAVVDDTTYFTAAVENRVGLASVRWAFPDGSVATGRIVEHVFSESGEATVVVTVRDEYGAERRRRVAVDVLEHPPSDTVGGLAVLLAAGAVALVALLAVAVAAVWVLSE